MAWPLDRRHVRARGHGMRTPYVRVELHSYTRYIRYIAQIPKPMLRVLLPLFPLGNYSGTVHRVEKIARSTR